MIGDKQCSLTHHAMRRLNERFPELRRRLQALGGAARIKAIYGLLYWSYEDPSFLQHEGYAEYLQLRYGLDGPESAFKFYVNQDIVFTARFNAEKAGVIVTVTRKAFWVSKWQKETRLSNEQRARALELRKPPNIVPGRI